MSCCKYSILSLMLKNFGNFLFPAVDYTRKLQGERRQIREEINTLKQEIAGLHSAIRYAFYILFPNSSAESKKGINDVPFRTTRALLPDFCALLVRRVLSPDFVQQLRPSG